MVKNTNYFSHDFNARHDPKMVKLRLKMGMNGIGIYWALVEMLYEQGGEIKLSDIDFIAKEWREKRKKIEEVIQNFDLFEKNSEVFWSLSVNKRLEKIQGKSVKAKESASKRWNNDANALQTECDRNASKVKYSKVKESKVNNIMPDGFSETISLDEKKEKEKEKISAEKEKAELTLYQKFIDVYFEFFEKRTGVPYKFNGGVDGKAVKEIISFILRVSKDPTDDGALNSWKHMLSAWDNLDNYHKGQLKLSQVNSNFNNIINQIKNAKSKSTTSTLASEARERLRASGVFK